MFRITFNGPSQKYNLKSAFVVRFIGLLIIMKHPFNILK